MLLRYRFYHETDLNLNTLPMILSSRLIAHHIGKKLNMITKIYKIMIYYITITFHVITQGPKYE